MENAVIFAVPFGKRLRRKLLNGEQKEKFIDRMDRAHNLDLRKIEMMKLGKKSGRRPKGLWRLKAKRFRCAEPDENLGRCDGKFYIK
jgi:hypothetical protein